ncbi:MAG TPA: adenylosuccinate synthetase [Pyrinomonadaceae bacterium]|jgi:adenylosuccinate synthase
MKNIARNNVKKSGSKRSRKAAPVIVGAGFGDEGKGLLTDYFAAGFGKECIVARFNGGAQAGHTVVAPDGRRHVHSHFGSGALSGAATFLSRHFVSNPLLFRREAAELESLSDGVPVVFADDRGLVTTPYDMLVNQWLESARGNGRHGSCGVGFGETIERSLNERFAIRICDLADRNYLRAAADRIRRQWVAARLHELNVPKLTGEQKELLFSNRLRDEFIEAAAAFNALIRIARPAVLRSAPVVFEGAQGLLLDEDYGWFPHVTRSSTGLKNAVEVAAEAGIDRLDCVYATRAYATRHGAGPLPHELPAKPYAGIEDATNQPNPHQGALRFGWLDLDLLSSTIDADFNRYGRNSGIEISRRLAVTCLDQLDGSAFYMSGDRLCETPIDEFVSVAARRTGIAEVYASRGETRETIAKTTHSLDFTHAAGTRKKSFAAGVPVVSASQSPAIR